MMFQVRWKRRAEEYLGSKCLGFAGRETLGKVKKPLISILKI